MKSCFSIFIFFLFCHFSYATSWSYQVKINNEQSKTIPLDPGKLSFEAGPYDCEVTPITVTDHTEYRSLSCSIGPGSVSTGGLCTRKGHKFPSVQYAILNLNGPKNLVNVVVSCHFD